MKKVKLFLLVIAVMVSLSGCGGNIDLVKNGVMDFNKTTALGKALDNWESCESRNWEEFKTDNGIQVVQFSCQHKIVQFMSKLKSLVSKENMTEAQIKANHLDIASIVQTFQFTINLDDTFQIDNVQAKIIWEDGTSSDGEPLNVSQSLERLKKAYANELEFDPDMANIMTAEATSFDFFLRKSSAE